MRGSNERVPAGRRDGVVTSLVAKNGGSDRVVVFLDGSRAFDVATVVADQEGLALGDELSVEVQERLVESDAPYRARERALRFLALRDRSCHEVDARLREAGFDPEVSAGTVAWLQELGYLDDERFATRYAGEKAKGGWAERRVRAELLRKGASRDAVEVALETIEAGEGTEAASFEALVALTRRRFGRQFESDPAGATRRLGAFMGRRGYDWDTIHRVARALKDEAAKRDAGPVP